MAQFNSCYIRASVVQVHAPTTHAEEEAKVLYDRCKPSLTKSPRVQELRPEKRGFALPSPQKRSDEGF